MSRRTIIIPTVFLIGIAFGVAGTILLRQWYKTEDPYVRRAGKIATWQSWADSGKDIFYYAAKCEKKYPVMITPTWEDGNKLWDIKVFRNGECFTWKCHEYTPFLIRDDVLYYCDFWYGSPGCRVVAQDLAAKKQIWSTKLVAGCLQPGYSIWSNMMWMEFAKSPDVIVILGDDGGKYIEWLDPTDGRTVFHRLL
jgi:hypothetical protein